MKEKVKKSGLARFPFWALSLVTVVIVIILLMFLEDPKSTGYSTTQIIGYTFMAILIVGACFVISWVHPNSLWYTVLICNALGLLGFVSNIALMIFVQDYNASLSETILWVGILVFSIIAAFVGAKIGLRRLDPPS